MDIYESLSSPGGMLNEQIASQIFDILPEQGPVVVIMDRDGNCWASNSELFSKLNIGESFLKELLAKIDNSDKRHQYYRFTIGCRTEQLRLCDYYPSAI